MPEKEKLKISLWHMVPANQRFNTPYHGTEHTHSTTPLSHPQNRRIELSLVFRSKARTHDSFTHYIYPSHAQLTTSLPSSNLSAESLATTSSPPSPPKKKTFTDNHGQRHGCQGSAYHCHDTHDNYDNDNYRCTSSAYITSSECCTCIACRCGRGWV